MALAYSEVAVDSGAGGELFVLWATKSQMVHKFLQALNWMSHSGEPSDLYVVK